MARTIAEIQQSFKDKIAIDPILSTAYTSVSNTAIFKLINFVFSFCAFVLEQLHDLFKNDVNEIIANKNPHTPLWYVNTAKAFQYGFNLVPEHTYYDNTSIADDVVVASKIVAYAAFVELPFTRMKVAKLAGSDLAKLAQPELDAFVAYMLRVKDAGVKLQAPTITSTDPDKLKLTLRIFYNPLVLDANGARLDGNTATPVSDAIKTYLQNLDFNGLFSVQKLVDYIQKVEGVKDLNVDQVQTQYGLLPFTSVDVSFVPDSGYLIIENADLTITYTPQ